MKLNKSIIAICAVLVMLVGACALAESTVTVQGVGIVNVDANRAGISLGVREYAEEVVDAQSKVNAKIAAIIDALKEMGVDTGDISTNGIGIYPNYNYDGDESITDYTAYNNIYLTVSDVNNIGAYIDAAFEAGANSLDYVEFSAADTDDAAAQALALAVDSAKTKAQTLADAAGMKLGGILEIQENVDSGYQSNSLFAKSEEADRGAGTEVLASKQTVTAAVNVTFALED